MSGPAADQLTGTVAGITGTADEIGSGIGDLPIHQRLVLSNIAVEMGGKAGIVEPDERMARYLEEKAGLDLRVVTDLTSDDDASYEDVYTYDGDGIAKQVSKPSNPESAVDVGEIVDTYIDQIFLIPAPTAAVRISA